MLKNPTQNKKFAILFLFLFSSLGGILYGYDLGIISGALLSLTKEIPMSATQMSFIVGALLGGGALATLIAGPLADAWGRKYTIICSVFIFIIGVFLLLISHNFTLLFISRLIQGIGINILIIVCPLYISETIKPEYRGRNMTLFQLSLTFGILLAYIIGLCFVKTDAWRSMFATVLIPAITIIILAIFAPESPRWLQLKERGQDAYKALLFSRTENEAQNELKEIKESMVNQPAALWHELFSPKILTPFSIALVIAICNQLVGINSILQFAPTILKDAGLNSNFVAMLGSVSIGLVNFIVTILALFLVDKLGRKLILSIGVSGVLISLVYLSLAEHFFPPQVASTGYFLLAGLISFIAFFAIGPGVVVWLAMSELFPTRVRAKGLSLCMFSNSMASAILASVFLKLQELVGFSGVFYICAFFALVYLIVALFFLPETKGKSLEEIEKLFS